MSRSVTYTSMPSFEKWMKDSSVTFAVRTKDIILTRIDELLAALHASLKQQERSMSILSICEIFMTSNAWIAALHRQTADLKAKGKSPAAPEKDRYPAMLALFGATVSELKKIFSVNSDVAVSNAMKEYFGRQMSVHGVFADEKLRLAKYFTRDERAIYRLHFKGGLAYQYPWMSPDAPMKLRPAYSMFSTYGISRGHGFDGVSENYSGFVMTMDRDIYVATHASVGVKGSSGGVFHSSYTAGERVVFAGTLMIHAGTISAIRTDSGHYMTQNANIMSLLMALKMYGVKIDGIALYDYKNTALGTAAAFLASGLSWAEYQRYSVAERASSAEARTELNFIERMAKSPRTTNRSQMETVAMKTRDAKQAASNSRENRILRA
jgi:hypothetical protein